MTIDIQNILIQMRRKQFDNTIEFVQNMTYQDFKEKDEHKNTFLHHAFSSKNAELIAACTQKLDQLVKDGKDLNVLLEQKNRVGFTPVDRILQSDSAEKISVLLRNVHSLDILKMIMGTGIMESAKGALKSGDLSQEEHSSFEYAARSAVKERVKPLDYSYKKTLLDHFGEHALPQCLEKEITESQTNAAIAVNYSNLDNEINQKTNNTTSIEIINTGTPDTNDDINVINESISVSAINTKLEGRTRTDTSKISLKDREQRLRDEINSLKNRQESPDKLEKKLAFVLLEQELEKKLLETKLEQESETKKQELMKEQEQLDKETKLKSDQLKYNGAALVYKLVSHLHDFDWADNQLGGYGKAVINSTTDYLHGQGKSLISFVDSNIGYDTSTANFASYYTTPLVNHGKNITLGVTSAAMSYYGHSKMPFANFTISVLEKSAKNPDGYVHQTYKSVIEQIPDDIKENFKEVVKAYVTDEVLDGIKEYGGGFAQGAVNGGVMCKNYKSVFYAGCVGVNAGVSLVGKGAESVANLFAEKNTAKNVGVGVDMLVKTGFDFSTMCADLYNPFSLWYIPSVIIDLVTLTHDAVDINGVLTIDS